MSLRYAILAALAEKPRSGYDLSNKIDGSVAHFWNATHQQIYKELKGLDLDGWVSTREIQQSDKPDKKVYRLSAQGLKELKIWIAKEAELPSPKDNLLIKLFAGHLVPPKILLGVLEKVTELRKSRLNNYLQIIQSFFTELDSLPDNLRFQHLTLRRGILGEEAWLSWADEVREFLEGRINGH